MLSTDYIFVIIGFLTLSYASRSFVLKNEFREVLTLYDKACQTICLQRMLNITLKEVDKTNNKPNPCRSYL